MTDSIYQELKVVMITSSFCSRCHYNRNLWEEVLNSEIVLNEINIASEESRSILDQLQPKIAPTIYLIKNNAVILKHEGLLNSNTIKSIAEIYLNLKDS